MFGTQIYVIIPAYNESASIGKVIRDIPKQLIREIIVVDNGSTDDTSMLAENEGATVLKEFRKGYGHACLKGIDYLKSKTQNPDIVVFLDGDYSDFPQQMNALVQPIIQQNHDLVIGSRSQRQKNALLPQQIAGNWLATQLIYFLYGIKFTDLGPFRAIRWQALMKMDMQDKTFGWTAEMQVKACKLNLNCIEVPVNYRKRIGVSKISGTLKGTIGASYKILSTIFKNL